MRRKLQLYVQNIGGKVHYLLEGLNRVEGGGLLDRAWSWLSGASGRGGVWSTSDSDSAYALARMFNLTIKPVSSKSVKISKDAVMNEPRLKWKILRDIGDFCDQASDLAWYIEHPVPVPGFSFQTIVETAVLSLDKAWSSLAAAYPELLAESGTSGKALRYLMTGKVRQAIGEMVAGESQRPTVTLQKWAQKLCEYADSLKVFAGQWTGVEVVPKSRIKLGLKDAQNKRRHPVGSKAAQDGRRHRVAVAKTPDQIAWMLEVQIIPDLQGGKLHIGNLRVLMDNLYTYADRIAVEQPETSDYYQKVANAVQGMIQQARKELARQDEDDYGYTPLIEPRPDWANVLIAAVSDLRR